jgi:hypothetical protein
LQFSEHFNFGIRAAAVERDDLHLMMIPSYQQQKNPRE